MPAKTETFYCSLSYLLLRVGAPLLPLIALGTMLVFCTTKNRGPFDYITWQVITVVLVFSIPLLTISIWIYTRLFPLKLTSAGIHGHNERGKKQLLQWQDIDNIGITRSGGLPCHKLAARSSETYLLIPTFLKHYSRCKAMLLAQGVDLDKPTQRQPIKSVQKAPAQKEPRPQFTPIRDGKYIVITTERSREKSY